MSLKGLVATAAQLTDTLATDPLAHVVHGYHRFRRYAPRILRALDIHAASVAEPLLAASKIVAGTDVTPARLLAFLRRGSKWQRHLGGEDDGGRLCRTKGKTMSAAKKSAFGGRQRRRNMRTGQSR